jgi:hypothetical protein
MAVKRDRVAAQDHECRAGVVQLDQQVAKVLRKLDHVRRPGTQRQGISWRAYVGSSSLAKLQPSRVKHVTSDMASSPRIGFGSTSSDERCVLRRVARFRRSSARACRLVSCIPSSLAQSTVS